MQTAGFKQSGGFCFMALSFECAAIFSFLEPRHLRVGEKLRRS
jgi:hypothetical protein